MRGKKGYADPGLFAYNIALIPVAAGILYPFFGITFRPELAGLAMAIGFCGGGESIPPLEGVCAASKENNRREVKNDGD